MATSPALIEAATRHAVFLERLKAGEVRKFEPFLRKMDRVLRERLTRASLTGYQRDRIEKLLADVDGLLLGIYREFKQELKADLIELATYEAGFEARALERITTGSFEAVVPAVAQIRAAVLSTPLSVRGTDGGKLLDPFIEDWARAERQAVAGAIRRGYFEGRTTAQIIQDIRGTRANRYRDGLLAVTDRHAQAVVRTAVQHVATTARMETWQANDDLVIGYRWVSTLDSRTSTTCRSLDGKVFKFGKGPRPPAHINCRSTIVAELDGRFKFLRGSAERASQDGPVSAQETYYSWLKRQPAAFQDSVLGPTRGKLLRDGGLSAERFAELQLDKTFQPLTLDEMRRLEPQAFERAGL